MKIKKTKQGFVKEEIFKLENKKIVIKRQYYKNGKKNKPILYNTYNKPYCEKLKIVEKALKNINLEEWLKNSEKTQDTKLSNAEIKLSHFASFLIDMDSDMNMKYVFRSGVVGSSKNKKISYLLCKFTPNIAKYRIENIGESKEYQILKKTKLDKLKLSRQQHLIIKCLLKNKTITDIAKYLNVKPKVINIQLKRIDQKIRLSFDKIDEYKLFNKIYNYIGNQNNNFTEVLKRCMVFLKYKTYNKKVICRFLTIITRGFNRVLCRKIYGAIKYDFQIDIVLMNKIYTNLQNFLVESCAKIV